MSEALERVIAEQQKEIDRLRLMETRNIEAWQRENARVENLAMWAFSVLSHPESPECYLLAGRTEYRHIIKTPSCEQNGVIVT